MCFHLVWLFYVGTSATIKLIVNSAISRVFLKGSADQVITPYEIYLSYTFFGSRARYVKVRENITVACLRDQRYSLGKYKKKNYDGIRYIRSRMFLNLGFLRNRVNSSN